MQRISQNQTSIAAAVEEQTATSNEISTSLVTAANQTEDIAAFAETNRT